MKTALCLSGHMRTYKDTAAALRENLIKPLNADVFIHTWDLRDHSGRDEWDDINDDDYQELEKYLNPKKVLVQQQSEYSKFIKKIVEDYNLSAILNNVPEAVFSMYYKRRESFKMLANINEKYDLVILSRPDLILTNNNEDLQVNQPYSFGDFDLSKISMAPSERAMKYNSIEHKVSGKLIGGHGAFEQYSDIFMAGSYENMEKMSMLYEHIMLYLSKGCPLHAEKLLIYHCMVNNFEIHSLPGSFGIIREISFEKYMQQGKKIRL